VSGFAYNPRMAAYRSTLVHGGVANADPHALVQMLLDAALDRMTQARGCIERGEVASKAKLLHSCVIIIAELRGSLDLANVRSDVGCINEVLSLLGEIRAAWVAIAPQVRSS
jgi:flagellar protein FliS